MRALAADVGRIVNGHPGRYFMLPFSPAFYGVLGYRVDRAGFEFFGARWRMLRVAWVPFFFVCQFVSRADLHYRAEIGGGLLILHPSLGVVVSGFTVAGTNLTLTGGNCIGVRPGDRREGAVVIGNGVTIGANASVLSPAKVGDEAVVGAGAVVLCDVPPGATAVGVPATVTQ